MNDSSGDPVFADPNWEALDGPVMNFGFESKKGGDATALNDLEDDALGSGLQPSSGMVMVVIKTTVNDPFGLAYYNEFVRRNMVLRI